MNAKDEIIDWLRDAYAMERGLELTLKRISESDKHSEECRRAAGLHLAETEHHAQTVEALLKSLGADTSAVKTSIGLTMETVKGLSTALSHDEQIKDLISSYAMEYFEIACYQALAVAADAAGLPHIVNACKQIIADEDKMAEFISEQLPRAVRNYIGQMTMARAA